ncbi:Uncharacterised protein [Sphingomonas paucimobilis]|nr:Uncharacterised protein [Sphingomonas paucimobilis]
MIQIDPSSTSVTINTPNSSASTLLLLSGPVVMCRKKTRCTPIWPIASASSAAGTAGPQMISIWTSAKDAAVSTAAAANPIT